MGARLAIGTALFCLVAGVLNSCAQYEPIAPPTAPSPPDSDAATAVPPVDRPSPLKGCREDVEKLERELPIVAVDGAQIWVGKNWEAYTWAEQARMAHDILGCISGTRGPLVVYRAGGQTEIGRYDAPESQEEAELLLVESAIRHQGYSDARQLYTHLQERAARLQRSEYETTIDYSNRTNTEASLLNGRPIDDNLLFRATSINLHYDADLDLLGVEVPVDSIAESNSTSSARAMTVATVERQHGRYRGQNTFGAIVDVTTSWTDIYQLAFPNDVDLPISQASAFHRYTTTLSVPIATAKRLKHDLAVVVNCRLAEPFISNHIDYHPPTFDNPVAWTYNHLYLYVQSLSLWLVDLHSGKVLKRVGGARI